MSEVFSSPTLKVEQPRRGPFAKSRYRVLDDDGTVLAVAGETAEKGRVEALKTIFPGKSDLDAHLVLLTTPGGEPLYVVDKRRGRELTEVRGSEGELVGSFVTERIGRRYVLRDGEGGRLGSIAVDLPRNNFEVMDTEGGKVAHVRKKWAGLATHLLTTADKYSVEIFDPVDEPLRTMAVMTAIVMDLNLHESKDIT
ncbi:phospholipid scramblase-related protein [Actinomadura verrucosospora]|uniref:Scramblase family protein n=1 Tax=Actinomadura verrucosospora TaxID=46165 RepID=A0A7D3ZXZ9_ACTVE|nr:phospholipid scramblase-related protein [Actinomadura verrucosospora]QKG22566.1 Scramblase family protein [Actinomadura verrucosospora]